MTKRLLRNIVDTVKDNFADEVHIEKTTYENCLLR